MPHPGRYLDNRTIVAKPCRGRDLRTNAIVVVCCQLSGRPLAAIGTVQTSRAGQSNGDDPVRRQTPDSAASFGRRINGGDRSKRAKIGVLEER
jgi:hypothetical protein